MVDYNKFAAEIHEASVQKGFWDVDNAMEKHIAKMHSELSEAIQEERCDRPLLYVDDIKVPERITDPAQFDGRKPEGVAAELADFVMMVLDWAYVRSDIIPAPDVKYLNDNVRAFKKLPLPRLVNCMHESLVLLSNDELSVPRWIQSPDAHFAFMVHGADCWLKVRGIDLVTVIRLKMEYNKSRPALHGRAY